MELRFSFITFFLPYNVVQPMRFHDSSSSIFGHGRVDDSLRPLVRMISSLLLSSHPDCLNRTKAPMQIYSVQRFSTKPLILQSAPFLGLSSATSANLRMRRQRKA